MRIARKQLKIVKYLHKMKAIIQRVTKASVTGTYIKYYFFYRLPYFKPLLKILRFLNDIFVTLKTIHSLAYEL